MTQSILSIDVINIKKIKVIKASNQFSTSGSVLFGVDNATRKIAYLFLLLQ